MPEQRLDPLTNHRRALVYSFLLLLAMLLIFLGVGKHPGEPGTTTRWAWIGHFDHPDVSNGPTENPNLKIKNTKRIARGYRNFDHYRLRLLLNHGRMNEDHSPTRIRSRAPRLAA